MGNCLLMKVLKGIQKNRPYSKNIKEIINKCSRPHRSMLGLWNVQSPDSFQNDNPRSFQLRFLSVFLFYLWIRFCRIRLVIQGHSHHSSHYSLLFLV